MWLDKIVARVLGYVALAAFVVAGEFVASSQVAAMRFVVVDGLLVAGVLMAAPVVGATLIAAVFERRSVLAYGVAPRNAVPMLVSGAAWGSALVAGFVLFLVSTGQMTVFRPAMPFGYVLHLVTVTLAYFVLFAFTEALCFHGLVLTVASRFAGPTAGAAIAALAFGFAHVPSPGLGAIGVATLLVTGFGLALMARITGSIWWNVGFLAAFDWAQRVFYGNPPHTSLPHVQVLLSFSYGGDNVLTGGSYGIEASVIMLLVALAAVAVLVCIATKRNPVSRVFAAARTALATCAPAARIF